MSDTPNLEELLTDVSFVRWVRGEGNPAENFYWKNWMKKGQEHRELVEDAKFLLGANKHQLDSSVIEEELGKLRKMMNRRDHEDSSAPAEHLHSRFTNRKWLAAASILLIMTLLAGGLYLNYNEGTSPQDRMAKTRPVQEFQTGFGEKKTLRLEDGSEIVLNSNSQLRYDPNIKVGEDAEVWLQGEAYFDITHLENKRQRSFTVHTQDGIVQVLGTKFVINSFGEQTQAVLSKGEIKVKVENGSQNHTIEQVLRPGDLALFSGTDHSIALREVNPLVYTSWIEDKLVFEKTPMDEVSMRIENTFGVKIKITDESLQSRRLSGSIRIPNLQVLKEALAKLLDATVSEKNKVLYIEPGSDPCKAGE